MLTITTHKHERLGLALGLISSASCMRQGGGFTTFAIFGDYSRQLIASPDKCTEKNIIAQHARAVAMVGAAMLEAKEFYVRKAAGITYRECYAGLQSAPAAEVAHAAQG